MAEASHSYYSASSFAALMRCPGKKRMEAGRPDRVGEYAAWGTVAHGIADEILSGSDKFTPQGTVIQQDGFAITVDQEMADVVGTYVGNVLHMTEGAVWAQSETRTNYADWLGVEENAAWGTADFTALMDNGELQVHDLKTGRGVEVLAEGNEQMMLYAGGKLLELQAMGLDASTVRLVIHQPRLNPQPSEAVLTTAQLIEWLSTYARLAVQNEREASEAFEAGVAGEHQSVKWLATFVNPGEKQCKFCKAKAVCPRLASVSLETVFESAPTTADDFANLETQPVALMPDERLGKVIAMADMIEDWLAAVRAEGTSRLLAGQLVPGFKLVAGRRGRRKWTDDAQAEATLKALRLKTEEMYEFKLISPTTAAKLIDAGTIGPRQRKKVEDLITQDDGAPAMAPVTDKRPALQIAPLADQFEAVI